LDVQQVVDRLPESKRSEANYASGATGDQIALWLSADGRTKVTIRPSGTEPKMKLYTQVYGGKPAGGESLQELMESSDRLAERIEQGLMELLQSYNHVQVRG